MDKKPQLKIKYIDRPDIGETFADSVHGSSFDGAVVKVELCVTYPEGKPTAEERLAKRYPTGRLVLTAAAAIDLHNRLQQIVTVMERAGIAGPKKRLISR
ncbi:MAG: hypothetical protein M3O62_06645 [Pseudomonadota bacterium]|nr:hypothetical protein [Pseudomonadota bacterium]